MDTRREPARRVKTADTVFSVVQAVHRLDGATLEDLSGELGLARSTVYDHVSTLRDLGYLVREGRRYYVGLRFLDHGMAARGRHRVVDVARNTLRRLATDTGEVAWLVTEEDGFAVYLDKAKGDRAVQTLARIGSRRHLHYLASGKAILAQYANEEVDAIVERRGLPARTEQTITDRDALFDVLEEVRERGYAVNDREVLGGTRSVGVAIVPDDAVVGALAVTGPYTRLKGSRLDDVVDETVAAGNEAELKLSESGE